MKKKYLIRFWDKRNKQMLYPNSKLAYETKTETLELKDILPKPNRFVPMRHIGTDKKDKDIWERDIVIKDTFVDIENPYGETVYIDMIYRGIAYLTTSSGAVLRYLTLWETKDTYEEKIKRQRSQTPDQTKLVFSRSRCIGNLYENEDLLLTEKFEEI